MPAPPSPGPDDDLLKLAEGKFAPLSEAEQELLRKAPKGDVARGGQNFDEKDRENDPAKAESWGEKREIRAALLRWLCVDRRARELVDPKGIQVYAAKIVGALDLSFVAIPFPLLLGRCRLVEDAALRNVEIPALNLHGSWVRRIDADGARVKGGLFLREGFHAEGEVRLLGAEIGGSLECNGSTFKNPAQKDVPGSGKALNADGMKVTGGVFLNNGFRSEGEVRLLGAEIGGDLTCEHGTFKNPAQQDVKGSGDALSADRIKVTGSVFLRNGFSSEGEVRLLGAEIGGSLSCRGSTFKNPARKDAEDSGKALLADGIRVTGDVFLNDGFSAEGEVRLLGAEIGGDLSCERGTFKNPAQKDVPGSGDALSADRMKVKGSVFLRNGFSAEGEVRLLGAEIGGDLDCERGTFKNAAQKGVEGSGEALNADRMKVKGSVFLNNGFRSEGEVRLLGAEIGGDLSCRGGGFTIVSAHTAVIKGKLIWDSIINGEKAELDLTNVSADSIMDDEASWPASGKLFINGFVYGRISGGPVTAEKRLEWVRRQYPFETQPYRQLAKVLRETGDEEGARRVLFEMEDRLWKEDDRVRAFLGRWPMRLMVGYGRYPMQSLWWLAGLAGVGWILYRRANMKGDMVPRDSEAYELFSANHEPPLHYSRFSPLMYSVENSLPLVNLGQADKWQPEPPAPASRQPGEKLFAWVWRRLTWRRFLVWFLWFQILLGWLLATLFVGGVTGIIRSD